MGLSTWGPSVQASSAGAASEALKRCTARVQGREWLSLPSLRALGAGPDLMLLAWGNFLAFSDTPAPWATAKSFYVVFLRSSTGEALQQGLAGSDVPACLPETCLWMG